MLADHNAIDAHVPHLCGTMPAGFELVVNLLAFVRAFNGRAVFLNEFPLLRAADGLWK